MNTIENRKVEVVASSKIMEKEFTVYGTVEEPLFLAKDVAEWIDYSKTSGGYYDVSNMLKIVDDDEKIKIFTTIKNVSSGCEMWFLTENGLYEVLMQSRKPIAKSFKKEVKNLLHNLRLNKVTVVSSKSSEELKVLDDQNRIAKADIWLKLSDRYGHNETYRQILDAYATKALEDKFVLPLPVLEEKNYSATEIGKILGITPNKVGSIANKLGIKTDEYGKWYVDKSPYSSKEVNTFRYNDKGLEAIRNEILKSR